MRCFVRIDQQGVFFCMKWVSFCLDMFVDGHFFAALGLALGLGVGFVLFWRGGACVSGMAPPWAGWPLLCFVGVVLLGGFVQAACRNVLSACLSGGVFCGLSRAGAWGWRARTQRLWVTMAQPIACCRCWYPLAFIGLPMKLFLSIPIRPSVWARLLSPSR